MPRPPDRKHQKADSAEPKGVPLHKRWHGSSLLDHYHKIGPSDINAAVLFGKGDRRDLPRGKKSR